MTVADLQNKVQDVRVGLASDFRETINENFKIILKFFEEYEEALRKVEKNIKKVNIPEFHYNYEEPDDLYKVASNLRATYMTEEQKKFMWNIDIGLTSTFRKLLGHNFDFVKSFIMNYNTEVRKVIDKITAPPIYITNMTFSVISGPTLTTVFMQDINNNFHNIVKFIDEFDTQIYNQGIFLEGIHPELQE